MVDRSIGGIKLRQWEVGWMDVCMDGQKMTQRKLHRWMDGQKFRERIDGQVDGQKKKRKDGYRVYLC